MIEKPWVVTDALGAGWGRYATREEAEERARTIIGGVVAKVMP